MGSGEVWQARFGNARLGKFWYGEVRYGRHGKVWSVVVRRGGAWFCAVWRVLAGGVR